MKDNKYDAGNQGDVQRKKTKAQIEQERQMEELKELLQTVGGRYFVWKVLKRCRVFHTVSDPDPIQMALKSGARDVGLELLVELFDADSKVFNKMQEEANQREEDNG